ncbi:hypothetical protein, partial [Bacillus cereus]|uniref:hypothetical protein n=1 Tax=Bacillus cereus TaxID=1396 RepID=UPI0024BE4EF2
EQHNADCSYQPVKVNADEDYDDCQCNQCKDGIPKQRLFIKTRHFYQLPTCKSQSISRHLISYDKAYVNES